MTTRFPTALNRDFSILDRLAEKWVMFFFGSIILGAAVWKYMTLSSHDGGWELVNAYIPKTLMLLRGQDPYSSQPWAAPYPPLMFLVLGGILRLATLGSVSSLNQTSLIAWDLRVASLVADLLVGVVAFYALRLLKISGLGSITPAGVYLLSPGLAVSNYVWFHGDVFGYLILACSLLALVANRTLLGVSLLSLAVAFKLQPILSLLLVLVWSVRRNGLARSQSSILTSAAILGAGLVFPLTLQGYFDTIIGFNLSYGAGNGTASFTLMNLFNGPGLLGTSLSPFQSNMVWVSATAAIFTAALGIVWTLGDRMRGVEVVLLGLLAWLIPLRTLYPYYLVWAFIPFLFIGNIRHVLGLAVGFEALNKMANWSWNVQPNPFPFMDSPGDTS